MKKANKNAKKRKGKSVKKMQPPFPKMEGARKNKAKGKKKRIKPDVNPPQPKLWRRILPAAILASIIALLPVPLCLLFWPDPFCKLLLVGMLVVAVIVFLGLVFDGRPAKPTKTQRIFYPPKKIPVRKLKGYRPKDGKLERLWDTQGNELIEVAKKKACSGDLQWEFTHPCVVCGKGLHNYANNITSIPYRQSCDECSTLGDWERRGCRYPHLHINWRKGCDECSIKAECLLYQKMIDEFHRNASNSYSGGNSRGLGEWAGPGHHGGGSDVV
jgi:hypothetical protein